MGLKKVVKLDSKSVLEQLLKLIMKKNALAELVEQGVKVEAELARCHNKIVALKKKI
jgi:hypothetical protein